MKVPPASQAPRRKKVRPPRPKHVPVRTCVVCRESGAKRGLTRIVRSPEGVVQIDPSGRANGRGAYLCGKPACWQRAVSSNVLSRALNVPLTDETITSLTEFAANLPPYEESSAADSKDAHE